MRFFRFYAHYGNGPADQEALDGAKTKAADLLNLSGERLHSEILKLLAAPNPYPSLQLMCDIKVIGYSLGMNHNFNPDLSPLERLIKTEQDRNLPPDPLLRLGVLLFGGKSLTSTAIKDMTKYLHLSNLEKKRLLGLATYDDFLTTLAQNSDINHILYYQGQGHLADLLLLCRSADIIHLSGFEPLWQQMESWIKPDFPINGQDVTAHRTVQGPDIGKILHQVENWWITQSFKPDRAKCLIKLENIVTNQTGENKS